MARSLSARCRELHFAHRKKEVKKKSIGSPAKHKLTTDLGEAATPDRLNRVLGWLQQSIQRRIGSSINFRGRSVPSHQLGLVPDGFDGWASVDAFEGRDGSDRSPRSKVSYMLWSARRFNRSTRVLEDPDDVDNNNPFQTRYYYQLLLEAIMMTFSRAGGMTIERSNDE